jgi:exodeoxyribonuclease VII small subunit
VTETPRHSAEEQPNFEQAMAALEKVVHELEEGQLGLDQAVGRYEAGVKLLKQCHALLAQAERRIELLTAVDAQGAPVMEPFDEQAAASLEEKAKNRAQRRTAGRRATQPESLPPDADMDEPGGLF